MTDLKNPESQILKALATAGIEGCLVKGNASISGAEESKYMTFSCKKTIKYFVTYNKGRAI